MMKESGKIRMALNIAGERLALDVPDGSQNFVRNVEEEINDTFHAWRRQFPTKSDREIMAMVVYRFASFYNELKGRYKEALGFTRECLDDLGVIPPPVPGEKHRNAE